MPRTTSADRCGVYDMVPAERASAERRERERREGEGEREREHERAREQQQHEPHFRIAVIVPSFNEESCIEACLDSVHASATTPEALRLGVSVRVVVSRPTTAQTASPNGRTDGRAKEATTER